MEDLRRADTKKRALGHLRSGGVVVLPTDTLPGFSAAAGNTRAVERIATLKSSAEGRAFILLVSSMEMVRAYASSYGCVDRTVLARAWPAPLTVVLPSRRKRPEWLGDTVAVRMPAAKPVRDLIESLGQAVVSTSVNRAGGTPLSDPGEIEAAFGADVDMIVALPRARDGVASTLVDCTGDTPVVLRQGSYDWAAATGDSNPSK